jgi:1-phosphofructokinase family hexose kinase
MILTLTPNPTIDRAIFVRNFELGKLAHAEREVVTPSGKGVDASLVIHELGGETIALGLNAGLQGRLLADMLGAWGIAHDFCQACGETRTATVLIDLAADQQSTISASTLNATEKHLSRLLETLDRYADRAWGLICGGSLPPGLPVDSYAQLLRRARERGMITLLDTSKQALTYGVKGLPHVLKVNVDELQALEPEIEHVGPDADGHRGDLVVRLAKRLGEWASDALVVTMGGRGALAVTREGSYHALPPEVAVSNTAGAGDALNGGLMLARSRGRSWSAALRLGTAAAASVVMNEGTAICQRAQVEALLSQVCIEQIEEG